MSHEVEAKKRYEENPFVDRFIVPMRPKSAKMEVDAEMYLTTTGGEIVAGAEIRKVSLVDSDKFVKVFTDRLRMFFDLTPRSLRLLEVVMAELSRIPPGADQIFLNAGSFEAYYAKQGRDAPSRATYKRALDEMIRKGFLAYSTRPGLFFINPAIFFNGDRVRFVEEVRRKRVQKAQDARQLGLPLEPTDRQLALEEERQRLAAELLGKGEPMPILDAIDAAEEADE